jgi:hypothetical protein
MNVVIGPVLISGYLGWSAMGPRVQKAARRAARTTELEERDPWVHLALGFVTLRTSNAQIELFRF